MSAGSNIYELNDLTKTGSIDKEKYFSSFTVTPANSVDSLEYDPNLDENQKASDVSEDSPYPEVRAAVANTDDPEMLASTLRAWVIGLVWALVCSGLDQYFYFRFPSIGVAGIIPILVSLPIGRAWAAYLPEWKVFGISLNPGPFTIKEHVLIMIISGVASTPAYATDIFAVQRVVYNQTYSFLYQWLVLMSTQLIGFAMGGIARHFIVDPPTMIWPMILPTCTLLNSLHSRGYSLTQDSLNRRKLFLYATLVSFVWYFVPGYLFTVLSWFSWVCFIRPNNQVIAQLFGYRHGLGLSMLTFDWAQISSLGNPLTIPWWSMANVIVSFLFFGWFLTPILYFTNTWYSKYMPLSSTISYDNQGLSYDVARILNPDLTLNLDAYHQYSPLFLSTAFALQYGLSFASLTATVAHTILYYRKQIWTQSRRSLAEQSDIHAKLMSKYSQVPQWWYLVIFLVTFIFGIIGIHVWSTQLPVWAFILALIISFIFVLPVGIMAAITSQGIALNVISELIIGYALPGRPVAMMLFKTYGYNTMAQALNFISDMKFGHYMKIPPKQMFWAQVIPTIVAGTVQIGVQAWMFTNISDMCSPTQKHGFICVDTQVFGTSSIMWGVIGPALQFTKSQIYRPLLYFFLIGALAPVATWLLTKKYPRSFWRYVNFPVIFSGYALPGCSGQNYVLWSIMGFIFQFHIKRRNSAWWSKYNYVLGIGLDTGVAISALVIFFLLQLPDNGNIGLSTIQSWWGNTAYLTGADGVGVPVLTPAPGETFGPATW